jgi:hypothetical protein
MVCPNLFRLIVAAVTYFHFLAASAKSHAVNMKSSFRSPAVPLMMFDFEMNRT